MVSLQCYSRRSRDFSTLLVFIVVSVFCTSRAEMSNHQHATHHGGRANADIFLDERDSSLGRSETHIANMLESHLLSQVKGMVDAHGEVHIENEGKSQDSFHSSDLLRGQGRGHGANTGKGKNRHKSRHKSKMSASERQRIQLENRLRMATHAKTWAKTQARAMAKAAAAQQAKERQRLRAEAAAAAHDELMVLSRMERDLHKAQRATAASLPKLELNPRLARQSPRPLSEDEKLLEMLKHPERYVEKNVDLDDPAIPAKPNATQMGKAAGLLDDILATTNPQNSSHVKHASHNSRTKGNVSKATHAKHLAIARHVIEKIKQHHEYKRNVTAEKKKPHTRATAFLNLASFLNIDSSILHGHSLEHLRPAKATNHHYRKKHVVRHHAAAPSFWPKKRVHVKKIPKMRFREGKTNVAKGLSSIVKKVFTHSFWHTRPTAKQQSQQAQQRLMQNKMRFQETNAQQNMQNYGFGKNMQQPVRQNGHGHPQTQQRNTVDSPFGYNDLNSQLSRDAAKDFQNVRNENNAAAERNSPNFGAPGASFSSGSGGLESPANGGLPSMAMSNTRPTDPTIGVGSSGGNPFAGKMPPPSAVTYTYGKDARNSQGLRPPPPPPAAAPPPPPVGQGSRAMPLASGPQPVKPGSSNGINAAFLPQTSKGGNSNKPITAPPPPLPMAPQQAGAAASNGATKSVMSPSVVMTIPIRKGGRL